MPPTLNPVLFAISMLVLPGTVVAADLSDAITQAELSRVFDTKVFEDAARSDAVEHRRMAARAAGRIRAPTAAPYLFPFLKDRDGSVRRAALFALGQVGGSAIVLPIREALPKLERNDWPHALEALGKSEDPRAVATVVAYLTDRDPEIRGAAALAVFRLGDVSALTEVFAALESERSPEPRWKMVYTAYRLTRNMARTSGTLAREDNTRVRILARSLASERPYAERVFAAAALGAIQGGSQQSVHMLTDGDPRVVVAALNGLALDPTAPHLAATQALVGHADALVRETLIDAWIAWEKRSSTTMEAALPSLTGKSAMRVYVELVRRDRTPETAPPLDEASRCKLAGLGRGELTSNQKTIDGLRAAAEACTSEKVPEATANQVLRDLLQNSDMTVRATAVTAVSERKLMTLVSAIVAAAKTATGRESTDVWMETAGALAAMDQNDPFLLEAAGHDEYQIRLAARTALAELGETLPTKQARTPFRLQGKSAATVIREAATLKGARVTLKTNRGSFTMVLLPDEAPVHCLNFAAFVSKGFYDGKTWHRVVADFVIQGGGPRGDGWGGPGYFLPDEIGTRPYVRGTVGMPKSVDDTGGCQIFITHLPTPHLDGRYTVFAQVIEGLEVVDRIRVGDRIEKATIQMRTASNRERPDR